MDNLRTGSLENLAQLKGEADFEVRTRYGRSVRVTGHHWIFVEGSDGEPVARFVEELQEAERVAIARRIEVPERDRTEVSMLDVWEYAEGDPWDLLVEAPGLGGPTVHVWLDTFGSAEQHFGRGGHATGVGYRIRPFVRQAPGAAREGSRRLHFAAQTRRRSVYLASS
jgi:hypothetical protein